MCYSFQLPINICIFFASVDRCAHPGSHLAHCPHGAPHPLENMQSIAISNTFFPPMSVVLLFQSINMLKGPPDIQGHFVLGTFWQ